MTYLHGREWNLPLGGFRTVLADPPWRYTNKWDSPGASLIPRSAEANYTTMSVDQVGLLGGWEAYYDRDPRLGDCYIAGFPIKADAFLWLWVTNPLLVSDDAHRRVCKGWGFKPKQLITWVKGSVKHEQLVLQISMGHYTRGATEHMVLATRGLVKDFVKDQGRPNAVLEEELIALEDTIILESRTRHSRKPKAAYELIEHVCPGPYLELFAREPRESWTSWGNAL